MKKPPRFITYLMILTFLLTINPLWPHSALAADPVIDNIYIERTDNEILETASGVIEIDGQNLKDAVIRVRTTGGGGSKVLGVEIGTRLVNLDNYIKFSLPGDDMRSILWSDGLVIGGNTIAVDDSNMAAITSVAPAVAFTVTDTITINGSNLDKDTLTFGNGSLNGTVNRDPDNLHDGAKITIAGITGDVGLHDVIFTRERTPAGVTNKLTFRKLYQNQFRVVEKLDIAGLEMYPNIGQPKKTTVYFQAQDLGDYSVFFLRNETDPYYKANMGTDPHWTPQQPSQKGQLTVVVPELTPGTYHVVLTNKMVDPQAGVDLRSQITKQMPVGDFIIVSSTNAAEVVAISPASGPTMNPTPIEVVAYNMEELNINGLNMVDAAYTLDLADANTTLEIEHGYGHYKPGEVNKKVDVTRTIKVTVGALAVFQDESKQKLVASNYDTLSLNTGLVQDSDIASDPVFDVSLDIKTTLTVVDEVTNVPTGEKYVFTEQPIKKDAFTFIKSYDEPVATKVTPNKIQVESAAGGYAVKEDMYIGISGSDFIVSKYIDSATGEEVVHYPEVILGGFDTGAGAGPGLCFRREGKDPTVVLGWDQANQTEHQISGAYYEVYNGTTVVTGAAGNDTGNRILIKIPAGMLVDKDTATTELVMANPKKNSSEYGYRVKKSDLLQFVVLAAEKTPVINSVTPNIISTDGAKNVRIDGYNFQSDVKLYLEDTLLTCKRDASGKIITFDAPAWKEGKTRILVMNGEGGSDSAQIIYVQSQTKPTLTSISPPAGTINTLVTLNGTVFMTPDPTAVPWDLGIYRLIGSRVLFGDRDINDYYYKSGTNDIDLKAYTSPAGKEILSASGSTASMASYYYGVLLKTAADKFYVLNYNDLGEIILTDGTNEYEIYASSGALKAKDQSGGNWDVAVTSSTVALTGTSTINLSLVTPYVFDTTSLEITGNRVKVTDHGKRIYAVIPDLLTPGLFDVTVVNPDTNSATLKNAFTFYRNPQRLPKVTSIDPNQGSVSGGYYIKITGANFEDNGTVKTRVFINSIEVAAADVKVGLDGTTLDVKVPAYPGDLKKEYGVDHKAVPITILNPSDGGSIGLQDAFTYVLPRSNPIIDNISKTTGSAAGGEYIEITGRDFRFYEPYEDGDGDFEYDAGETFTNVNGVTPAVWDDLSQWDNTADPNIQAITNYQKILPKVYFGSQLATVKNYGNGYLGVLTPTGTSGTVDVYIVNNDYGVSNKKTFSFTSSKPTISSILPATGRKQGAELVEILGSGYVASTISLLGTTGASNKNMTLVRFGSIDNLNSEDGTIVGGEMPILELPGNMTVSFSANSKTIDFTLVYGGVTYSQTFNNYDGSPCFFDMTELTDSSGNFYPGCELVKVYSKDRRLIVERGYAPNVVTESTGHLIVTTPTYYTVGQVGLKVVNPDGGTVSGKFEYKNPATSPTISDITRNGTEPVDKTVDGENIRALEVNYKGGNTITITGTDFTANATIQIGSLAQIKAKDIVYTLPTTLSFIMPAVPEAAVGTAVTVVVTNEDGGVARSDLPSSGLPIKMLITKGETAPEVSNVVPAKGPAAGGTRVSIKGKDFREDMSPDYPGELKVYFGAQEATVVSVKYDEIIAVSPAADPGEVEVKVENPDGESSTVGKFTYVSSPTITGITLTNDNGDEVAAESISVKGGQQLNITGTNFMEGCRVVFIPVIEKTTDATASGVVYYVTSKTSNGGTSNELDPYVLKSGTDGTEVTVVDSTHLTVKTPQGKLDATGIMIVNEDQGASTINNDIKFGLPQLDAPLGVTAVLVRDEHYDTDRFIKVQWEAVTGATGYEIYVVSGSQTKTIGSSKYTSLVYDDLEPNTSYKFVVKALGDFGSSKPSAESNWIYTGSTVGAPDRDGGLGEKTEITAKGSIAQVNVGSDRAIVDIDLTKGELASCREVQITIPASVIYSSGQTIKISGKEYDLEFEPGVFQNDFLVDSRNEGNAGIRFRVYPYVGSAGQEGGNSLSTIYCLEANCFVGQEANELDELSGSMRIKMRYDTAKAKLRHFTKMDLCWYEPNNGTWLSINSSGTGFVGHMGNYCVMGRR
ncbi:MAG: IPT/TIG domain-containing protein [Syntrophomonadaceae bacterium]